MIVCNLTKPESTLDQVKKSYPKLNQTDAALIATALVISGRYAQAVYDGSTYSWPDDYDKLTVGLQSQLRQIAVSEPTTKKKASADEEPVEVKIGLVSNYTNAETILGDRGDLKTLLSDILSKGVEYQYASTDIGWQWALDRANWSTLSDGELTRHVKLKAVFQGEAVGTEMGTTGPKKKAAKKVAAPVAEAEVEAEGDSEDEAETA